MKRLALLAAGSALLAIPAVIGLSAASATSTKVPVPAVQTTEVHGVGHGADDAASPAPSATRHAEPGDDNGGLNPTAEPGDDNGGLNRHVEPGDDRGGTSNRGPGSSNSGHGGRDDGPNHH